MDDYWPLLGTDAVPERSHEPVGQVGLDVMIVATISIFMMVIMIDGHDDRQHVELSVADQSGRAQK